MKLYRNGYVVSEVKDNDYTYNVWPFAAGFPLQGNPVDFFGFPDFGGFCISAVRL